MAQILAWGLYFNNLESKLSEDACIVIPHILALQLLRFKKLKIFNVLMLNFEPLLGPSFGWGLQFEQFRIFTTLGCLYINLPNCSSVVLENNIFKYFPIYFLC